MDETAIKKMLMELRIAPNLAGYRCLACAIQLYCTDQGQSFTKELYPAAGRLCTPSLTGDQVERLIRYAVEAAWQNRDAEIWRQYFPQGKKPTNGEFISTIAELLSVRKP